MIFKKSFSFNKNFKPIEKDIIGFVDGSNLKRSIHSL